MIVNLAQMKRQKRHKIATVLATLVLVAQGVFTSPASATSKEVSTVNRCTGKYNPFSKVRSPWSLAGRTCDVRKSSDYGSVFATFIYEVDFSLKGTDRSYSSLDKRLDVQMSALIQSINTRAGWSTNMSCPPLTQSYYECLGQLTRLDRPRKEVQYANVRVESFVPGQFSTGRSIRVVVEIQNGVWE